MCVSVFAQAITRGKRYPILAIDVAKRQVRVRGDNERTRWYPMHCFDVNGMHVPVLESFQVLDVIRPGQDQVVEVDVLLSNGQRRWCWFATPGALAKNGDRVQGTRVPFHFGNRHVIVAGELSDQLIELMLRHIDNQGALEDCTLIVPEPDRDDAAEGGSSVER